MQRGSIGQLVEISSDELNLMQYACGYVPFKLIREHKTRQGRKYENFVECLGNMAVVSELGDHDLFSYTKVWFETVNRGGLFPLNDKTFLFFIEIER